MQGVFCFGCIVWMSRTYEIVRLENTHFQRCGSMPWHLEDNPHHGLQVTAINGYNWTNGLMNNSFQEIVKEEDIEFGEEYMSERDPSILHFLLAAGDEVTTPCLSPCCALSLSGWIVLGSSPERIARDWYVESTWHAILIWRLMQFSKCQNASLCRWHPNSFGTTSWQCW